MSQHLEKLRDLLYTTPRRTAWLGLVHFFDTLHADADRVHRPLRRLVLREAPVAPHHARRPPVQPFTAARDTDPPPRQRLRRAPGHRTHLPHRLREIFAGVTLPLEPVLASLELQDAITHIIGHVVEATGCDDSWYREAETALKWFLEHCGLDLGPQEREQILHSVGTTFRSWLVRPEQVRHVTDQATMNLVRKLFDERSPQR